MASISQDDLDEYTNELGKVPEVKRSQRVTHSAYSLDIRKPPPDDDDDDAPPPPPKKKKRKGLSDTPGSPLKKKKKTKTKTKKKQALPLVPIDDIGISFTVTGSMTSGIIDRSHVETLFLAEQKREGRCTKLPKYDTMERIVNEFPIQHMAFFACFEAITDNENLLSVIQSNPKFIVILSILYNAHMVSSAPNATTFKIPDPGRVCALFALDQASKRLCTLELDLLSRIQEKHGSDADLFFALFDVTTDDDRFLNIMYTCQNRESFIDILSMLYNEQ